MQKAASHNNTTAIIYLKAMGSRESNYWCLTGGRGGERKGASGARVR